MRKDLAMYPGLEENYVDQADLNLENPPASASKGLEVNHQSRVF